MNFFLVFCRGVDFVASGKFRSTACSFLESSPSRGMLVLAALAVGVYHKTKLRVDRGSSQAFCYVVLPW